MPRRTFSGQEVASHRDLTSRNFLRARILLHVFRTGRVIESGVEKSKIPIYCQRCKQKQIVHVYVRAGRSPMNNQTVTCIKCKKEFDVLVADPIIGGPFPE